MPWDDLRSYECREISELTINFGHGSSACIPIADKTLGLIHGLGRSKKNLKD